MVHPAKLLRHFPYLAWLDLDVTATVPSRNNILLEPLLQLLSQLSFYIFETGLPGKIFSFVRVINQMVKFVGTPGMPVDILPFLCSEHPHRTVLIINYYFLPESFFFANKE